MRQRIIIASIVLVVAIGGVLYTVGSKSNTGNSVRGELGADSDIKHVYMENGVQVVELFAKGGYRPEVTVASSGVPTILRFKTQGSFDCSTSVVISELDVRRTLPLTGTTDIELGTRTEGSLSGSCSMGMYHFSIEFKG